MSDSIPLSVGFLIFLTLTPNTHILFTAIPYHIISLMHCTDIQHPLKPFTVTSGEMRCHGVTIHTH